MIKYKSAQGPKRLGNLLLAILLAFPGAQSFAAKPNEADRWTVEADVYLWGAGIGGKTTSGGDLDISFSDLINNFDMGFMGIVAANKGKWTLMADVIYLNVSADNNGTLSIPLGSGIAVSDKADVKLKGWIPTLTGQYRLIDNATSNLHLLGGVRYLWLETDIKLTTFGPFRARTAKVSDSGGNWDGIVGVRGQFKLNEKWYLRYYGDIGAGDSELTWQLFGGIGYRFQRVDAVLGYRHMDYQFDSSPVFDSLNLSGPMAGIKFFF